MRNALMSLLMMGWSLNLVAAEPTAAPPPQFAKLVDRLEIKDGDTIVFLGDSITHQCLYTQYIEDYFYTRFPHLRIRFHNSGVGGDRAADALARFDRDVAEYQPRYVTVLLGMNDGSYGQWSSEMFATYEQDMTALIDRIQAVGATPILMTPTMYDTRAALLKPTAQRPADSPANKYYNATLAYLGAWVREQAINRGLGFVDMYSPLNNLSIEQRKVDANFTFIPDAVHPGADGQFIMGFSVLDQMQRGPLVSSIVASYGNGQWTCITNKDAKTTDLQGDADDVSFTHTAVSLPWVVPDDAALGFQLTRAGHRSSNESVRVIGLPTGRYDLKIDGVTVGTYSAAQLGFKVELQENKKTPEYQQALAVALLNKERNEKAMKPLRDLWRDLKVKRRAPDPQDLEKFLPDFEAKLPELRKRVEEYDQKIYAINKPQPHRYEIVPAAVPSPVPAKAKAKRPALKAAVVK